MFFSYPLSHSRFHTVTGLVFWAFGLVCFLMFASHYFQRTLIIHNVTLLASIAAFIFGIPRLIAGYKSKVTSYELDQYRFKILHPEGIDVNVEWKDIRGFRETARAIIIDVPHGREEVSKELRDFAEFYGLFKKYAGIKDFRVQMDEKPVRPSPVTADSPQMSEERAPEKIISSIAPADRDESSRETLIILPGKEEKPARPSPVKPRRETLIIPGKEEKPAGPSPVEADSPEMEQAAEKPQSTQARKSIHPITPRSDRKVDVEAFMGAYMRNVTHQKSQSAREKGDPPPVPGGPRKFGPPGKISQGMEKLPEKREDPHPGSHSSRELLIWRSSLEVCTVDSMLRRFLINLKKHSQ